MTRSAVATTSLRPANKLAVARYRPGHPFFHSDQDKARG